MAINKVISFIDKINEWIGNAVCLGLILIATIGILEVILRYIFSRPTIWAWDVNEQLFAAVVLLGGGYTLLHNMHIRLDVIYDRCSPRLKAILDVATFPLFFLFFIILLWQGTDMAWSSVKIREVSSSFFAPPIYPLKMCVPIGAFLILLQGLANFARDIMSIITKQGK